MARQPLIGFRYATNQAFYFLFTYSLTQVWFNWLYFRLAQQDYTEVIKLAFFTNSLYISFKYHFSYSIFPNSSGHTNK